MIRHWIRGYKSVNKLGPRSGGTVFAHYLWGRLVTAQRWAERKVQLRSLPHPIWLRPGVSDWIVMERIFLDEEYAPLSDEHDRCMDALQQRLLLAGRKPLIIDCGANIGLSSVWLSERFPEATVVCVEPEPNNFRLLARNAENYKRLVPMHAAISDRHTRVRLTNEAATDPWSWRTQETEVGEVATITVEDILALYPDHSPMLIKIDIEGFEVELLRGSAPWLDHVPLLVFEMHDWLLPWAGTGHCFLSGLTRIRRDYLIHGENLFAYSHAALRAGYSG